MSCFGETAPEAIEAHARHLQHAAEIAGLIAVEKQISIGSIAVMVLGALQEAESDQRVEKIAGAARMQSQPAAQIVKRRRAMRQFGE